MDICRKTVLKLVRGTTTTTGLTVKACLDSKKYPVGIKISDKDFDEINITRNKVLGKLNYTISPST
ncbi:MAG: hypothetical protein LBW85_12575 [Deltaproteobacteria bacterium]|nr:hypothetical protein [Deltaproteobacteria bacterium]